MSNQVPHLIVAEGPTFYSELDETQFFGWLQKIEFVESVRGVGRQLNIMVAMKEPTETDLRELTTLFSRYKMTLEPLERYKSGANAHLFAPFGNGQ